VPIPILVLVILLCNIPIILWVARTFFAGEDERRIGYRHAFIILGFMLLLGIAIPDAIERELMDRETEADNQAYNSDPKNAIPRLLMQVEFSTNLDRNPPNFAISNTSTIPEETALQDGIYTTTREVEGPEVYEKDGKLKPWTYLNSTEALDRYQGPPSLTQIKGEVTLQIKVRHSVPQITILKQKTTWYPALAHRLATQAMDEADQPKRQEALRMAVDQQLNPYIETADTLDEAIRIPSDTMTLPTDLPDGDYDDSISFCLLGRICGWILSRFAFKTSTNPGDLRQNGSRCKGQRFVHGIERGNLNVVLGGGYGSAGTQPERRPSGRDRRNPGKSSGFLPFSGHLRSWHQSDKSQGAGGQHPPKSLKIHPQIPPTSPHFQSDTGQMKRGESNPYP